MDDAPRSPRLTTRSSSLTPVEVVDRYHRMPGIFGPWMSAYVLARCLWVTSGSAAACNKSGRQWLDSVLPDTAARQDDLLIGVGDLGRAVAKSARPLGARIIGVNTTGKPIREVGQMCPVDRLRTALRMADFVVLLVPLRRQLAGGSAGESSER